MKKDPVTSFALEVVEGKHCVCQLVRLACQRHLADLERPGLEFDLKRAMRPIRFIEGFCRHSKGEWAGKPLVLEPWQRFAVGCLFGWQKGGKRRFRTAYIELPRKNGKSTLAAAIGLYLFLADGEPGAEVYTAATTRDQARIVHGEAIRMVRQSAALKRLVTIHRDNISWAETASRYSPLGADYNVLDGLNIHGAIIDELHAHRTRALVEVLETGTSARRQPLIIETTTAGTDRLSICREHHDYTEAVLRGTVQDDTWFGLISTTDEGDDWQDPAVWRKANLNYGLTVKEDDLTRKALRAAQVPAAQNAFRRLHLNEWTQQTDRWVDLALWDANNLEPVKEEALKGRVCFGGLDLAAVSDMTAWVLLFPLENGRFAVLARFWVPAAQLDNPRNRYREQYRVWAQQGWLRLCRGETINYGQVRQDILADSEAFRIKDLNVDRFFQAHQLAGELEEAGLTVFALSQSMAGMTMGMRELERLLLERRLNHGGNPVLRWNVDNLAVRIDQAGNMMPDKATSQGKIDGIVALVMAIDRALRHKDAQVPDYASRGVWVI